MPLYKAKGQGAGNIFVTNITGAGNISITRNDVPNEESVQSVSLENKNNITINVEWDRSNQYEGLPTVNGVEVIRTSKTGSSYLGYAIISNIEESIGAMNGNSSAIVPVISLNKPTVSSQFTGSYPGTQTELKENDEMTISFTPSEPITAVEIQNFGACKFKSQISGSLTVQSIIADRGNVLQTLDARIRVKNVAGTWSDWTGTLGNVECNNLHPSIVFGAITYPANQQAIKNVETVSVVGTCSDYDDILYSSSEVSIDNLTTYEETKTNVARLTGDYNVMVPNYTISCTRTANDANTINSTIIKIAHIASIVETSHSAYFRSGGADGTNVQTHTISLITSQLLIEPPTIEALPKGTWVGEFIGAGTTWTRDMLVDDVLLKGTYSFGALNAVNLSGLITTTYTGSNDYVLKGFVSRQIPLQAFTNAISINTQTTNYDNVTMTWSFKDLPNKRPLGTTAPPDPGSWSIPTLGLNPTLLTILDTPATQASSQESIITVEET